jgi:hypothetical protein
MIDTFQARNDDIIRSRVDQLFEAFMIANLREKFPRLSAIGAKIFSRENLLALIIALILIAVYITTAGDAPIWLYQGF